MTEDLKAHIEEQFHKSVMLNGLVEALVILHNEGYGSSGAYTAVLDAANSAIERISGNLDSANLPKGGDA